jgi:shikimate kinase
MHNGRHLDNLALIGFMGTGKTSAGRLVAEYLRFDFLDTDELIQVRTGRSIPDIFAVNGETSFRALERDIVGELAGRTNTVISTGGGLPADPANLAALKAHALVVCLWASPEKIWERVRNQSHRPLLHDPNPQAKIRDLLERRAPFYRDADVLINTDRP